MYGAKKQYSQVEDNAPTLNKAGKKFIQEVCGVFLYLARAVDRGLLPALSSLACQQANLTGKTMELCKQILDYMAMQDDAILTYHASNMVLAIHSNALYLSEPKSQVAREDTCSWPERTTYPSTMVLSSISHK
jgi:hypothetical protein